MNAIHVLICAKKSMNRMNWVNETKSGAKEGTKHANFRSRVNEVNHEHVSNIVTA